VNAIRGTPDWNPCEDGLHVGEEGTEGGYVLLDEEHLNGARITLEERAKVAPYAITCGIFGWVAHTCFASTREEADILYDAMKRGLEGILQIIPSEDDPAREKKTGLVNRAIEHFVAHF